jgi:hypothetical protein
MPQLRMKVGLKLSALYPLLASSKATRRDHDFVLRRLGLASSLFLCENDLVAYPYALNRVFSTIEEPSLVEGTSVLEIDSWDIGSGIRISRCQVAAEIVSFDELDPTTATPDDMEAKNVLVRCFQRHQSTYAMTWRLAVCCWLTFFCSFSSCF